MDLLLKVLGFWLAVALVFMVLWATLGRWMMKRGITLAPHIEDMQPWALCANCSDPLNDPHEGVWSCGLCGAPLCSQACRRRHKDRCQGRRHP